MKVRLELEVGAETAVVIVALEALVKQLEEVKRVLPPDSYRDLYIGVSNRLVADIQRQIDESFAVKSLLKSLLTPRM